MRRREMKLLAMLLSTTMFFTVNMPVAALGYEEASKIGIRDEGGVLGWSYETSDSASVKMETYLEDAVARITITNPVQQNDNSGGVLRSYRYGKDLNISFAGKVDFRDLFIDVPGDGYISAESNNKITISVSASDAVKKSIKEAGLNIYVRTPYEIVYETDSNGNPIWEAVVGIEKECVHIETGEGLNVVETDVEKPVGWYHLYSIKDFSDNKRFNYPANPTTKTIADYEVAYYTEIPCTGKKMSGKFISISDNNGYSYKVTGSKVVRLKTAPADQGSNPTVSNAGIIIKKVEWGSNPKAGISEKDQKRLCRKIQKDLKRATRVRAKDNYESLSLPVIVYPYRLTEEVLSIKDSPNSRKFAKKKITLKEKNGKYKIDLDLGKLKENDEEAMENSITVPGIKLKIKSGEKDLFKNGGRYSIEWDSKKGLKIESADIWTGTDGLSADRVRKK